MNDVEKKLEIEVMALAKRVRKEMEDMGCSKRVIDLYFSSGEFVKNLRPVWK